MVLAGYHNTSNNLSHFEEVVNCLYDFFKFFCSNLNAGGKTMMRLLANNYEPNETFKIIREWTGLTQEELAKELNRRSRHGIKEIETGNARFYYETILEICKKHNIKIIFEKDN